MKNLLKYSIFLLVFGFTLASCDKDAENKVIPLENGKEEPLPGISYVLGKNTKIISSEWEKLVTEDVVYNYYSAEQGNVSFHVTQEAQLPQVGEILLIPNTTDKFPLGFMGKVVDVKQKSGQVEIVTQRVAPTEVYDKLDININTKETRGALRASYPSPIPGPSPDLPIYDYKSLSFHQNLSAEMSVPLKEKGGKEISARLSGSVTVDASVVMEYSAIGNKTKEKYMVELDVNLGVEVGVKGTFDTIVKLKRPELSWKGLTILAGMPIELENQVSPALKLEASVSGTLSLNKTKHFITGNYKDDFMGDGKWHPLEFPEVQDGIDWGLELEAEGLIGLGITNDFRALLGGMVGPHVMYYSFPIALKGALSFDVVKALSGDTYSKLRGNKLEFLLINGVVIGVTGRLPFTELEKDWDLIQIEGKMSEEAYFLPNIQIALEGDKIWYVSKENTFFAGKYGLLLYDKDSQQKDRVYVSESTKVPFSKTIASFNPEPERGCYVCPFYELDGITYVDKSQKLVFGTKPVDDEGLTGDINKIVPPNILDKLKNELGIPIHGGNTPPNIEGTFLATPLEMVKDMAASDQPEQWDMYVTFSNQNNSALTINADYTMQCEGPWWTTTTMSASGPGSFIVGQGNKFTVFVDARRTTSDVSYTAKTVEIFSGEIYPEGIKNYHWAVIMVDDNGDPQNAWIENEECYMKKDSDGFSEKTESRSKSSRSSKSSHSSTASDKRFVY